MTRVGSLAARESGERCDKKCPPPTKQCWPFQIELFSRGISIWNFLAAEKPAFLEGGYNFTTGLLKNILGHTQAACFNRLLARKACIILNENLKVTKLYWIFIFHIAKAKGSWRSKQSTIRNLIPGIKGSQKNNVRDRDAHSALDGGSEPRCGGQRERAHGTTRNCSTGMRKLGATGHPGDRNKDRQVSTPCQHCTRTTRLDGMQSSFSSHAQTRPPFGSGRDVSRSAPARRAGG